MKNKEIAALFDEIGDILELRGENVFRVNAYRRAARTIDGLGRRIEEVASAGELMTIPGIGKDLAGKIAEYLEKGRIEYLEELRAGTPVILLDMMRIPGVGPKTAVALHAALKIKSLEELKQAAIEHRIQTIPKMKAKTEENILKGLEFLDRAGGRTPIGQAYAIAQRIIEELRALPEVDDISAAGSLRRFRDTVGDIDILVTSKNPVKVIERFTHLDDVTRTLAEGMTKGSVITRDGIQADLRVVESESYGAALNYFTGSKEHNVRLREIAVKKKMKLNEYGIFKIAGRSEKRVAGRTEEEVYETLGLPYIPPEIRENSGEIEAARAGKLPRLVEMKDIKGDLHCHSDYSDGEAPLAEIAAAAKRRGYKYLLVTDHSRSLHVAHGLSRERLLEQMEEIDRLNERLRGFRLLKGSEVDILPDGSLDMDDDLLERLDLVVVAIHSNFKMPRAAMTRRVVRAVEHPRANILAHPTGRLIGARDAFEIDIDEVIAASARAGTAIEINSHPARLDLDAANARKASMAGVKISLGTDSHVLNELEHMIFGVGTARRGWLTKHDVLNTLDAPRLLATLGKKGTER